MKATSLVTAILIVCALPPSAAVVEVDLNGGGDFTTIGEGIDAANLGDTVLVWPGVYAGPMNRGLDFHGVEVVVRALEGPGTVTIDCEHEDRAFYLHTWEDTTCVIDGLTIARGLADVGGAIRCYRARVRLANVTFTENRAHFNGGAIYLEHSDSVFRDVTFFENWTGGRGGAVSMVRSSPVVSNAGFKGNVATIGGGALHTCRSSPTFRDCRFYSNRAGAGVGGVGSDLLGSPHFVRCLFHRSTAPEFGGAFILEGTSPRFVDCRFYENEAREGGALKLMQCAARFDACEFIGNVATDEGGGIHAELVGAVELYGCLFDRNTSGVGGALRIEKAALTLGCCRLEHNAATLAGGAVSCWANTEAMIEGCTFSANHAGYLGGAIYATGDATLQVMGSTLAENGAPMGGGLAFGGSAGATVSNTIVAFSDEGEAVHCAEAGSPTLTCCDLFGNAGGDWVGRVAPQYGGDGNICEDPGFCLDDHPEEPYALRGDSVCAPQNNLACGLIGAWGVGCPGTPVVPSTWGAIKARFR
jgi:predicted outer membrane repeat protein